MRSPGAMMAVVNTPDNIPAANSCGYLQDTMYSHIITHRVEKVSEQCKHPRQSNHLRKDIIGGFLLEFLAHPKPKETDSKHGRDSDDRGRHAFIESFHTL